MKAHDRLKQLIREEIENILKERRWGRGYQVRTYDDGPDGFGNDDDAYDARRDAWTSGMMGSYDPGTKPWQQLDPGRPWTPSRRRTPTTPRAGATPTTGAQSGQPQAPGTPANPEAKKALLAQMVRYQMDGKDHEASVASLLRYPKDHPGRKIAARMYAQFMAQQRK